MEKQYKISIIVAVYNVEPYIHRCVDSLLNQTYRNIEVILVDDGSTDGSATICDDYAAKDNRVKVVHKPNGGVSSARQVGLEASSGDFVIHADPDDYAESDMIASLLAKAIEAKADIVTCDFFMNDQVKRQDYVDSTDLLKKQINVETICVCWNTFVRRDFITENHISFKPVWLCMSEDFLFICRLLVAGAKAVHLPKAFYHYWVSNGQSLTNKRSQKKLHSIMAVIDELGAIVPPSDYDEFYTRKKYAVQYAYQGKMFKAAKRIYPEIRQRMLSDTDSGAKQLFSRFSWFAYYNSRINYYCKHLFFTRK